MGVEILKRKRRCRLFPLLHRIDQLKQLATVDDFDEWFPHFIAGHHVDGRSVVEAEAVAEIAIRLHFGSEFALRIDREGKVNLVVGGEFFGESMQIIFADFKLVLKHGIAELFAELFRMSVEVAREYSGVVGPRMHLQRKIVDHDRDVVGSRRFLDQRVRAGTIRAFEIFEHHDGNLRTLGRP